MSFSHEPWFAGNVTRDEAAALLVPLCDGSFLIRTSQSRVGYTLTVKYVEIRHIMIVQSGGKFGFSNPTNFASLPEMIYHFGRTSLACYNAELETTLAHPYKTAPAAADGQACTCRLHLSRACLDPASTLPQPRLNPDLNPASTLT